MSADDIFDAVVAIAREVVGTDYAEGERFRLAIRRYTGLLPSYAPNYDCLAVTSQDDYQRAASEFAAPYLARIAELEAELASVRAAGDRSCDIATEVINAFNAERAESNVLLNDFEDIATRAIARAANLEAENKSLRDAANNAFNAYDNAATVTMPVHCHIAMQDLGTLLRGAS